MRCERCGAGTTGYELHDYCASKNLCEKCMAAGCCGKVPAVSGSARDDADAVDVEDGAAGRGRP